MPSHRNQSKFEFLKQHFEAVSQGHPDAVLSFCDRQFSGARICQLGIAKLGWLAGFDDWSFPVECGEDGRPL
jgi:hypothetical protein